METSSQVERTHGKASARGPGQAKQPLVEQAVNICTQINQEEQLESEMDLTTQGSSTGK